VANTDTEIEASLRPAADRAGEARQTMPVTLLTGFLGSGKTTCLNLFLRSPQASGIAVLVNEFGEIDIDGAVLSANLGDKSKLLTLPNGCICCAVQEDLAQALVALDARRQEEGAGLQRCIIETTGLADPGAILRGIGHDPGLKKIVHVDQTVTVCAADRLPEQLVRFAEVPRQIGIADRIVITKFDLVSETRRTQVKRAIADINPLAEIQVATHGAIAPENLFGPTKPDTGPPVQSGPAGEHHLHNATVRSFTVRLAAPLDPDRFRDVLSFLIMRHAENLLRIKGIARFSGEMAPRLLNGVHDVFSSQPANAATLATGDAGAIVFIGEGLPEDAIRADLKSCEAAGPPLKPQGPE